MIIRIYLAKYKIDKAKFAELLNCTTDHLGLVANEKRPVSKKMAISIEKATNGEITAKELLEERKRKEKSKREN